MSKLYPVPKICQVKSQSLDYLANKSPWIYKVGWMLLKVLIGLPGLTAQPQKTSSAAQQQECKFLEARLKKGEGVGFFARVFIWQAGNFFVNERYFSCNKGEKSSPKDKIPAFYGDSLIF